MKIFRNILVVLTLASPAVVLAADSIIPNKPSQLPDIAANNARDAIVVFIQEYLLPFAGIIAVLFIIIGGYQYIFSGANEDLAEKGKKTLTNAVIGLVIIILSYVIVRIVARTLMAG
jgi:type IV secretory pathway VirB2 component (pilin)